MLPLLRDRNRSYEEQRNREKLGSTKVTVAFVVQSSGGHRLSSRFSREIVGRDGRMLVPINHGICQCRASQVGFPAVMSRPSLYPSLAKSELAVCITRSPRGLTRHRCAYLPLFLPRVSLSPSSRPAAIHPVQDVARYKKCMPRSGA